MDSIDHINGSQAVQAPLNINSNQVRNQQHEAKQPPPPPFNVEITQLGQLFSAIEESGESAKSDLKQFQEKIFEALQNGNFDADELVDNASEELKTIAQESGIELKPALEEFSSKARQLNNEMPPPPPPPPAGQAESSNILE